MLDAGEGVWARLKVVLTPFWVPLGASASTNVSEEPFEVSPLTVVTSPLTVLVRLVTEVDKPERVLLMLLRLLVNDAIEVLLEETLVLSPLTVEVKPLVVVVRPETVLERPEVVLDRPLTVVERPDTVVCRVPTLLDRPVVVEPSPVTVVERPETVLPRVVTVAGKPDRVPTVVDSPETVEFSVPTVLESPETVVLRLLTVFWSVVNVELVGMEDTSVVKFVIALLMVLRLELRSVTSLMAMGNVAYWPDVVPPDVVPPEPCVVL